MSIYDALDLKGPDGRPSHSKILSTVAFFGAGVFTFLRCHDMNVVWLGFCTLVLGLPYGFSAYKMFLTKKDSSVSNP